jgi:ankyrin repeat protein
MLMVDHGADATTVNDHGETALDVAVRHDRQDAVSFLLDHDISVLKSSRPLIEAARKGKAPMCRLLLDMGAEVNAEVGDKQGLLAFDLTIRLRHCSQAPWW